MLKILIAEDDPANRKFITKIASKYGETTASADGMQAVNDYKKALDEKAPFQLVCLDVMMPKIDGYKTMDTIRELEEKLAIPKEDRAKIIMISALDEGGFDEELAGNKYDAYLNKPIDLAEFETLLKGFGMLD